MFITEHILKIVLQSLSLGENMISNSLAKDILNEALSTGGDYAEIYFEDSIISKVSIENTHVESSSVNRTCGIGIRILKGFNSVYGHTSDLSRSSLMELAHKLSRRFNGERIILVKDVKNVRTPIVNKIEDHLYDVPLSEKVDYCKAASKYAKDVSEKIVRTFVGFYDRCKVYHVWNADKEIASHYKSVDERGRLTITAIAKDNNSTQSFFHGPGKCAGWNYFKNVLNWKELAIDAGKKAVALLTAKECPQGKFDVVVGNGFGGVMFHEACGHSLEASATSKNLSVFSNCIGKQIASPLISAYDDGSLPNEWGSSNVDSEGVKTRKNELIKDGICVNYLVDRLNGRRLNMEPNGTSRRESFCDEPTSRMSNTYIAPGKDDPKDIIKDTKLGVYVVDFGGGSVDTMTGEFNFSASEAYIIRDGKVCEMVKGCTLTGTGKEVLMNIDRVGNDLKLAEGLCGASSGTIFVDVGQPTIRIKNLTVGGRGGKLE